MKNMSSLGICLSIISFLIINILSYQLIYADTIYLKNGKKVEGKVWKEMDERISIVSDTDVGLTPLPIFRKDIEKIEKQAGGEELIERCARSLDYYQKGNTSYETGEYQQAIDFYNKTVELNPKFLTVYYNLGLAYSKLQLNDEAKESFNKALQIANSLNSQDEGNKGFIEKVGEQLKRLN